jgi:DNA adenine methylase
MHTHNSSISPFIKWAGGKTQLLDELVACLPSKFNTYFEPFLGGGALFFKLSSVGKISKAVISDLNKDLINCYIVIRDDLDFLISYLNEYQKHVDEMDFFYEVARPAFNKIKLRTGLEKNAEKAALLIYLNKTCFNGLYRVNSKGDFNVPWGRYKSPSLYNIDNLRSVNKAIKDQDRIQIKCCDYREAVKEAQKDDFIYFDPPYQPLNQTSSFTQYTSDAFTPADQRRLAETFTALDKKGSKVMLSNSYSPLIEELYKEYIAKGFLTIAMASRAISCKGSGRGKIPEYIVYNYKIPKLIVESNAR